MKRHDLPGRQVYLLAPFFPPRPRQRGGPWKDDRTLLNALLWRLNSGAPWRDLPERYGPHPTAHDRFTLLRRSGLLDRILETLQLRLDEKGRTDFDLGCVDSSSLRASRAAAGASNKK